MKACLNALLLFLILVFTVIHCSKNPTEQGRSSETSEEIAEVLALGSEIDSLEELALTKTTGDSVGHHLWRALRRLDSMLKRVRFIVMRHDNEEAKALYEQARDAQKKALEAARIDSFEVAFDHVKESRYLAIEAVKLIKEDNQEQREEMIQRLREEIEEVRTLLDEVRTALQDQENRQALRVYERARSHFHSVGDAMQDHRYRRAGFHLRRAKILARIALKILENSD